MNSEVRKAAAGFRCGGASVLPVVLYGLTAFATQHVVPGGAGDRTGGSWANARADVQSAIDAAALPGEQVWVAAGRYPVAAPVALRSGSTVLGGFAGTETDAGARDWDANVTVLDGLAATQVVRMAGIASARFDGLVVTGGWLGIPTNKLGGAGILLDHCSACVIANCKVLHNTVTLAGATASEGGGLYVNYSPDSAVENCLFTANFASAGTSLSIMYSPRTVINACRFVGEWNSSANGVIRVNGDGPTYQNCVGSGNYTRGGAFIYSAQVQTVINCTACFTRNASGHGTVDAYSPFTFRNNLLAYNSPVGLWEMNASADPSVENNLFHGNTSADYFDSDGTTNLVGAAAVNTGTVPDKASGNVDGDPLFARCPAQDDGTWTAAPAYNPARAQTTLTDTHAAFVPGALKGRFLNPDTAETLYRHAEIADNTATSVTVWGQAAWAAAGNGYRIYDYRLRRGSPALDAGLAAGAPAADMDGKPRSALGGIDIGAYETSRKLGTVVLLSTPPPAPVWTVRMTSDAVGRVLSVSNATLAVTVTEGVYWTIRDVYTSGTLLVGATGANGAVANVMEAARPPGNTDGWVGTGHGFETISSYAVALDGTNVLVQPGDTLRARTVTLTKASNIGPLDQVATLAFPETGDRFTENTRFTSNRTLTNSLNFVYAFMHCNQNALTQWRAWLTPTNVLDGACVSDDGSMGLYRDVRAVALFGPAHGKGLIYVYPEVYCGDPAISDGSFLWDRVYDNKLYFRPDLPGTNDTVGAVSEYAVTLIPFQAEASGWKDTAGDILEPLFEPE